MKKLLHTSPQKGFTLIETIVAILILTMTVGALLTLAAGGFFSVRYARNDIVANNLLQESLEYVRNSRDTAFQGESAWEAWEQTLNVDTAGIAVDGALERGCFSGSGCTIDPYSNRTIIRECAGGSVISSQESATSNCEPISFFADMGLYGYKKSTYGFVTGNGAETSFVRTIRVHPSNYDANQLVVTATIRWLNGTNPKTLTQSILVTNTPL